ncbi:MAG: DUF1566 domain-containing protein [bacterium]
MIRQDKPERSNAGLLGLLYRHLLEPCRSVMVVSGILTVAFLISAFFIARCMAGSLDPPAPPNDPNSAVYTLEDIYNWVDTGAKAAKRTGGFTEPASGPSPSGHSVNEIMEKAFDSGRSPVPKTGQGVCHDASGNTENTIPCTGTGQDGELKKGLPWPDPRFKDHGDGTVTDSLTGLMWTKDATLPGETKAWAEALAFCNDLVLAGHNDWRLPNIKELLSLIDYSKYDPALPSDHPFSGVVSGNYWSSTSYAGYPVNAWVVNLYFGDDYYYRRKSYRNLVWPVRSGR